MFFAASADIWRSTAISLACIGRPATGPGRRASTGTSANKSSIIAAPITPSISPRSAGVRGR
jgi:hypothetical protein